MEKSATFIIKLKDFASWVAKGIKEAVSILGANTTARAYNILASQIEVSKIGMEGLNILEVRSILLAHTAWMLP